MEAKVYFYNDGGNWYANVLEHTKEENLMVGGADAFLEQAYIAFGNRSKLEKSLDIVFTDKKDNCGYVAKLTMTSHNQYGAYYSIEFTPQFSPTIPIDSLWLCNVTHTVCGEHPKEIYIRQID